MRIRAAALLLVLTACRHPIAVDTSAAKLIPRDLAVEQLKEILAQAVYAACAAPRSSLERKETTWEVKDDGLEARASGKASLRVAWKDVTGTRLDQVGLIYQVRFFTAAHPGPKEDFFRINWPKEAPARRALELVDALRQKS